MVEKDFNYSPEEMEWDEDDWERFFQEKDQAFEDLQKLILSYGNDEEAVEKAFDDLWKNKIFTDCNGECENCSEKFTCAIYSDLQDLKAIDEEATESEEEIEEKTEQFWKEIQNISAWKIADAFSQKIMKLIDEKDDEEDLDTRLKELCNSSLQIASHIAAGHGIGYEKGGITGNIVKNKISLRALSDCINILDNLKEEDPKFDPLYREAHRVREAILIRILELRKRSESE